MTVNSKHKLPHIIRSCEDRDPLPPILITVRQFSSKYPWPSESAMRSYIYRANELGMASAFVRVGRRVLIDVNKFFELVQNEVN